MSDTANHNAASVVAFRADASLEIGTGHVMRCLTLAEALAAQGAECHFLCREHPGHLIEAIEARGFTAHRLPMVRQEGAAARKDDAQPDHTHWLGTTWEQDAEACRPLLAHLAPDWLVVDHYALDARWEAAVLPERTRLLAIDDLADRPHCAGLLLDQNLGRAAEDYAGLVPMACQVLAGPQFALLRPEFAELRESSLARRRHAPFKRLLISLGGVDKDNATGQVLDALKACDLPKDLGITVVMGATAPWLYDVKARAAELPWPIEVVVNVSDMARRMAEADLAIGAAGSTSWERCCLGLPTLMLVLAENQQPIARALDTAGAAICVGRPEQIVDGLSRHLAALQVPDTLQAVRRAAAQLTAGEGVMTLCHAMHQEDAFA
ncbi:UDP-2,4-diacetamido-2,4,6-trideoxy-beta-L-altropyranose hydrolase [Halomonas sp. LBP4]|uniref:UDP-2,4-diacetamido-2,4, 6-trideoxy-beta-L-altropyranose hydrolase n=1 Tax=Halomonas sp. LBP4 TaxID=2044917 RepID=UPI000D7718B7|nr:UDP-2,4-diacetamido-2,4,6-trideoxy-beta-L-altropyranose hydrolase [Halomonas sp. LBP4]PXY00347.1 UDP-2,4-diacetamido-2,4,6-trideoxy-beta-L-altropyranose hydrolase [Halomonas sp. LBP4]